MVPTCLRLLSRVVNSVDQQGTRVQDCAGYFIKLWIERVDGLVLEMTCRQMRPANPKFSEPLLRFSAVWVRTFVGYRIDTTKLAIFLKLTRRTDTFLRLPAPIRKHRLVEMVQFGRAYPPAP